MSESGDYKVGYRRPPKHTRWKKGESGNALGRRTAQLTLKEIVEAELEKKVPINEDGMPVRVSKKALFVKARIAAAIKGDASASRDLMSLITKLGLDKEKSKEWRELTDEELELILTRAQLLKDSRAKKRNEFSSPEYRPILNKDGTPYVEGEV